MNIQLACRILGVEAGDSPEEIKRKYRRLAAEIHPDMERYKKTKTDRDITEVNAAYEFLVKQGEYQKQSYTDIPQNTQKKSRKEETWDAAQNPEAYVEREIYQYAEDSDGERIGIYRIATGKYYWNPDAEDFSLFLKSILTAVDHLIEITEEKSEEPFSDAEKFEAKKELIYLLAGQYTDVDSGLKAFSREEIPDEKGTHTFYLKAMLELDKSINWKRKALQPGERLYSLKLKNHRLYLGKKEGEILGYLSFSEDPLYYILIPMFENREVQVKIEISEKGQRNRRGDTFYPLHLWIRKIRKEFGIQESINVKIDRVLEQLKKYNRNL